MENNNHSIVRRRPVAALAFSAALAAMVVVLASASTARADEGGLGANVYHAYHNTLGGVVIASPSCGTDIFDEETKKTGLDLLDGALGIRTDKGAFWTYDGLRTWRVKRVGFFGSFDRYVVDGSDCVLYSNSVTAKNLFDDYGLYNREGYDAVLFSLPRVVD